MNDKIDQFLKRALQFLRKHISRKHPDIAYYFLIFLSLVICVIGLNLFVELTDELLEEGLKIYDDAVTEYVIAFRSPGLTSFFKIITFFGGVNGYLTVTVLVAVFLILKFRHWQFTLQLMGVVVLAGLSNVVLKRFIDRPRPAIEHLVVVESLSYPSGHAMCAMAYYGFLTYLFFHIKMARWLRAILCVLFVSFIFLIGLSRIYLGVHFPTDVLGGFIAGIIWLAFCIILFNIISLYRRKKARRDPSEKEENLE
ncbi:MAG TPA: phosphatase PAP2 family protein [Flavobacteriaceae bacterium]|nr:phosphatase PAP2 family protein [Flavobacteriaceae bacterium]